jgi:hypothetical protein
VSRFVLYRYASSQEQDEFRKKCDSEIRQVVKDQQTEIDRKLKEMKEATKVGPVPSINLINFSSVNEIISLLSRLLALSLYLFLRRFSNSLLSLSPVLQSRLAQDPTLRDEIRVRLLVLLVFLFLQRSCL